MKLTYERIEKVLRTADEPLAAHEFSEIWLNEKMPVITSDNPNIHDEIVPVDGRRYVGVTEATLARRLREMRELGRVTATRRTGTAYVEYALVVREPVMATIPNQEVW